MAEDRKQLELIITARDEASKAFVSLQNAVKSLNGELDTSTKKLSQASSVGSASMGDLSKAMLGSVVGGNLLVAGIEAVGSAIVNTAKNMVGFIEETTSVGAKIDQSNIALQMLAHNYGVTAEEAIKAREGVRLYNISNKDATELVSQLIQSQIDLGEATKLTNAATNMSIATDMSSSDIIKTVTLAIGTQNTMLLHQLGITKGLSQMYEEYANAHSKAASALTEEEQAQAILNAVIKQGEAFEGAYEAALNKAGKAMLSIPDRVKVIQESMSAMFTPLADAVAPKIEKFLRGISLYLRENTDILRGFGTLFANAFNSSALGQFIDRLNGIFQPLLEAQKLFREGKITSEEYAKAVQQVSQNLEFLIEPVNFAVNGAIALSSAFMNGVEVFRMLFEASMALGQELVGLGAILAGLGRAFIEVVTSASTFTSVMAKILKGDFSGAMDVVEGKINNISNAWQTGMDIIQNADQGALSNLNSSMERMEVNSKNMVSGFNGYAFNLKNMLAGIKPVAEESAKSVGEFGNALNDAANTLSAKAKQILEQIQELNEAFADQVKQRTASYKQRLNDILIAHRDNANKIRDDMKKETADYEAELAKRTQAYQQQILEINNSADQNKQDVLDKFDEETAQIKENLRRQLADNTDSDETLIKLAQETIKQKEAERDKELTKIEEARQKDLTNAQTSHDAEVADLTQTHLEKISKLQEELDAEVALQKKYAKDFAKIKDQQALDDITRLKNDFEAEMKLMEEQHQKKLKKLEKQFKEEQKVKSGTSASKASGGSGNSGSSSSSSKTPVADSTSKPAYTPSQGIGYTTGGWRFTGSDWVKAYETGGVVRGVGATPAILHGGETVLTPEQTKGLLAILENISKNSDKGRTGMGINQTNYITAEIKNDADIDSLIRRLTFRLNYGSK